MLCCFPPRLSRSIEDRHMMPLWRSLLFISVIPGAFAGIAAGICRARWTLPWWAYVGVAFGSYLIGLAAVGLVLPLAGRILACRGDRQKWGSTSEQQVKSLSSQLLQDIRVGSIEGDEDLYNTGRRPLRFTPCDAPSTFRRSPLPSPKNSLDRRSRILKNLALPAAFAKICGG